MYELVTDLGETKLITDELRHRINHALMEVVETGNDTDVAGEGRTKGLELLWKIQNRDCDFLTSLQGDTGEDPADGVRIEGDSSSSEEEEEEVSGDWYEGIILPEPRHSFEDPEEKEALVPLVPGLARRMVERDMKRLKGTHLKPVTVYNRKVPNRNHYPNPK